jgi:hypothetical protein
VVNSICVDVADLQLFRALNLVKEDWKLLFNRFTSTIELGTTLQPYDLFFLARSFSAESEEVFITNTQSYDDISTPKPKKERANPRGILLA